MLSLPRKTGPSMLKEMDALPWARSRPGRARAPGRGNQLVFWYGDVAVYSRDCACTAVRPLSH